MVVAHAAAVAASTPIPTPSPTPVVTPVVHAVVTVVSHPAVVTYLNNLAASVSPADLIVAAGIVATAVQTQLNKLPFLQHEVARIQAARRFLVSVVLPVAGTGLAGLATGHNTLGLSPLVYLVAQGAYYAVKLLRGETVTAPAVEAPQLATEDPVAG